jgi:hypothetical protein
MPVNKRFFYFLIVVSIVVALFYSILLGLIVFVADLGYFFYLGRNARKLSNPSFGEMRNEPTLPAVQSEPSIQGEGMKIPCKFCNTMIDPAKDKTCPNCGAAVDLT